MSQRPVHRRRHPLSGRSTLQYGVPKFAIGMGANGANFAMSTNSFQTGLTQKGDDVIGDIALRDTIERQRQRQTFQKRSYRG